MTEANVEGRAAEIEMKGKTSRSRWKDCRVLTDMSGKGEGKMKESSRRGEGCGEVGSKGKFP